MVRARLAGMVGVALVLVAGAGCGRDQGDTPNPAATYDSAHRITGTPAIEGTVMVGSTVTARLGTVRLPTWIPLLASPRGYEIDPVADSGQFGSFGQWDWDYYYASGESSGELGIRDLTISKWQAGGGIRLCLWVSPDVLEFYSLQSKTTCTAYYPILAAPADAAVAGLS